MYAERGSEIPNYRTGYETPSSFSSSDHILTDRPKKGFYQTFPRWTTRGICQLPRSCLNNRRCRWISWVIASILVLTALGAIIWLSLVVTVLNRLTIPRPHNGLQQIVQTYRAPNATNPASPTWLENFSNALLPAPCHSHNDYWHRVPLYEGLAAGCISTEADIWYGNNKDGKPDLFIGHTRRSLGEHRTLRSLYLDPLHDILTHQNTPAASNLTEGIDRDGFDNTSLTGVFSMVPTQTFVLLLDFKTDKGGIWDEVLSELDPLRSAGYLTHWTPETGVVTRPLTIVASGSAPFSSILANTTYRDVFYDAPLNKLSEANTPYNSNNSYYASASLGAGVGKVWFGKLSGGQARKAEAQIQRAGELGLMSRYWDTPSWPVGWRNRVWERLVGLGESVLNADDLTAAARWDWEMCVVAGVNICN
ncbi:hypothetical protein F5884DRAFT_428500 [Xylogone sp. PMI_703]|nr:hypothetical protein F5884DRAFT_428500 [Xylogone sp. PMI_703]